MLDKLQAVEDKYMELESLISDPAVMSDMNEWQRFTREHAKLTEIVTKFREYKQVQQALAEAREMLKEKLDDDFRDMVEAEFSEMKDKNVKLEEELSVLLLPKDPNDDKSVIVEIRGGAGGDEAALFAGDLFRMYTRYAENQGWRTELLDSNPKNDQYL
ncbi:PCRF domain-containing protein [bacterium BFN5]|nr:PCRF domain-containing protein [bacterium BFN5]